MILEGWGPAEGDGPGRLPTRAAHGQHRHGEYRLFTHSCESFIDPLFNPELGFRAFSLLQKFQIWTKLKCV